MKGVWIGTALLLAALGIWDSNSAITATTLQTASEESALFETPQGILLGDEGQLIYPVIWDGEGEGPSVKMTAEGNAHGDYDVVVAVTKGGVLGEAKGAVSTDGGESWMGETVLKEDVSIRGLGVELHFIAAEDSDELVEGERYAFRAPESFVCISDHPDEARMAVYGHPTEKAGATGRHGADGRGGGAGRWDLSVWGTDVLFFGFLFSEGVHVSGDRPSE